MSPHTRIPGMSQTPSSIMRWARDQSGKIDLSLPAYSMSRHRRQRRAVAWIISVVVGCVLIGAVRWIGRAW